MTENDLKVPFSAPLNELDTEEQTYGCRANNSAQGVCAFTSDDCVCRKPSRAWKKQYIKLKAGELNG